VSDPLILTTPAALTAFLDDYTKRVETRVREETIKACRDHRDLDQPLSPAQVADEIDISPDSVYLAVRVGKLVNHAQPNPDATPQKITRGPLAGKTKKAKEKVLVRRGDAYALWANKVRP
jgi:hypothetical protein